jgi:dynein heavy chain
MSEGIDPLNTLSTAAMQARWQNEGLPADRISLENASIITNCARWPLIIDPQLQGLIWIKGKVGEDLITMQTSGNWARHMETALTMGQTVLLENLGEELDATLDPILSRAIYKKGKGL